MLAEERRGTLGQRHHLAHRRILHLEELRRVEEDGGRVAELIAEEVGSDMAPLPLGRVPDHLDIAATLDGLDFSAVATGKDIGQRALQRLVDDHPAAELRGVGEGLEPVDGGADADADAEHLAGDRLPLIGEHAGDTTYGVNLNPLHLLHVADVDAVRAELIGDDVSLFAAEGERPVVGLADEEGDLDAVVEE